MSVLDYGCGSGDFVLSAAGMGAEAMGIEPSSLAVERARMLGAKVLQGTIDTIDLTDMKNRFDLITLNHVLEHIPEPSTALGMLKELLKPEGHLWIAVPNFQCWGSKVLREQWHSSDIPRHLHHFTLASLELCGQQAGLRLVHLETATLADSMLNTMQSVLKYRARIPWRVTGFGGILARTLAPWAAKRADSRQTGEAILATFAA
jgi:2-polyprenyl-3-methyl-5-hydroxy-6-metoxy-1,4-benzoquinol methylase